MAELVGASALPDRERIVLMMSDLIRKAVLQQSAVSENDAYSSAAKQAALAEAAIDVYGRCEELVRGGVPASMVEEIDMSSLVRAKDAAGPDDAAAAAAARDQIIAQLEALK
jgi:V/A-type H+-transporting ATPase subunit A